MQDKRIISAPAKLNIFLKILGRREDGYHTLHSGVTFINLFDSIEIEESSKKEIIYQGTFKPNKGFYSDCIVEKTLNFLNLDKDLNLKFTITKNIPVQGGLGSASTNAAAIIKGLEKMNLIKKQPIENYIKLGSDIPCLLFQKNCLIKGIGEKIYPKFFPKYHFLLLMPNYYHSTTEMYKKLNFKINSYGKEIKNEETNIQMKETGNDFEKIVFKENKEYKEIFDFVADINKALFTRMTGSGSCIYVAFEKKEYANNANKVFKSNFKNLWSTVCENNVL